MCFHLTREEIFQLDQLGVNYKGKESRLLDTLNNLARRQFHFFFFASYSIVLISNMPILRCLNCK